MVYGYKTNKEFIDKSYQLLKKLDKKHLWDKDTLVVGLDKSVRPLAHTLRKISKIEGRETPDIRFFNYASSGREEKDFKEISSELKERLNPKKLSNYKKILILDEYSFSGGTLKGAHKILKDYFSNLRNKPKISEASLGLRFKNPLWKKGTISIDKKNYLGQALKEDTGITDKSTDPLLIQESIRQPNKGVYKEFVKRRKQLLEDVEKYLIEKGKIKEKKKDKANSLEKITTSASLVLLISGIFFSFPKITGNVIGISESSSILGIVLFAFGIFVLVSSRMLRRKF